jgi:uncharacterized membrane protein
MKQPISKLALASLLLTVATLSGLAPASAAKPGLTLCNETSYMLEASVAYQQSSKWKVEGWWALQPGRCTTVVNENLRGGEYYTFAKSIPGHEGGTKAWGGRYAFCTGRGTYSIINQASCEQNGLAVHGFAKIETGSENGWTNSFTEPAGYNSDKSRIAGIQRLLGDIGIERVRVDGFMGRKTRLAITKYKKDNGISQGDFLTEDLFDSLARNANGLSTQTGLELCNETGHKIYAAIGYQGGKGIGWVSRGWYLVPKGECVKAIKDKLEQRYYYSYAEAELPDNDVVVWGGEKSFCTNTVRFAIEGGDKSCESRGYDVRPFRKIDTENRGRWKDFFTAEDPSIPMGGPEQPAENQD